MKNVFVSLLIALCAIAITSCNSREKHEKLVKQVVEKQQIVEEVNTPAFKQSEDFINYILENKQKRRYEAIVSRLTLNEINEMAKVIIQRDGYVNWKLFLKEYDTSYQTVYRYLSEHDSTPMLMESDTIVKIGSKNNNLNVVKNGTTNVSSSIQR